MFTIILQASFVPLKALTAFLRGNITRFQIRSIAKYIHVRIETSAFLLYLFLVTDSLTALKEGYNDYLKILKTLK